MKLLATLILGLCPLLAQANLLISPQRLYFEPGQRSDALILKNISDSLQKFDIRFQEMVMNPQGKLVPQSSNPHSLASMVRYSPRRVTLEPGATQTIRMALRMKGDLEEGEYRSHLVIRQIPTQTETHRAQGGDNLALQIRPMLSMSIPVIARKGVTHSSLAIERAELHPHHAQIRVTASGNRSVYGDLELVQQQSGERTTLGILRGAALYPEIDQLEFKVPLSQPPRGEAPIEVVYREDPRYGSEREVQLQLQP
ncbi:molecular chaperone [Ferrimonas sp.]|uniref:fimbrial biogenesis chaperone n=1 Tax=Ferrimonas sp. TaxID=2080861 RepID=UPI003A94C7CD